MTRVTRVDRGQMGGVERTPQGYLRVDGIATRTGVLEYRNRDGSIRRELRRPEEVGKAASLATLSMAPVTDEHPPEMLTAANTRQYARGTTGESVNFDGKLVRLSVTITDADLIEAVEAKRKRELSCGYHCDLVMEPGEYEGQRYDAEQINITYNHLAVVPRGRAGPEACLRLDAAEQVTHDDPHHDQQGEGKPMPHIKIDGVDYEVSESAAKAITDKMRADAAAIEAAQNEAKEAKKRADKEEARADAAEEKVKERKDAAEIDTLVRARVALEKQAAPILGADVKLDSMSDKDVKLAVIKAVSPSVNLDGKSDDYIDARYDSALESAGQRQDHTGDLRRGAGGGGAKGDEQRVDHDDARKKMIEANRNAWKEAK